jgi:hypothetical protein
VNEDSKITDPVSQRKVTPIKYAFSAGTGDSTMLLFIDYEGILNKMLEADDKKYETIILSDLTMHLRGHRGLFCMVTTPHLVKGPLPVEFNLHYQLDFPPETVQINQWEHILRQGAVSDDELVKLVEQYPMHCAEIDFVGRQAATRSIILGKGGRPSLDCVYDIINAYRQKSKVSLLFGQG